MSKCLIYPLTGQLKKDQQVLPSPDYPLVACEYEACQVTKVAAHGVSKIQSQLHLDSTTATVEGQSACVGQAEQSWRIGCG